MKSHGLCKGILDLSQLKEIVNTCQTFIKQRDENSNYYGDINLHMKGIENIISKKIILKIKNLLNTNEIILNTVELHIQNKGCDGIPHHQDNFYHCTEAHKSLKFLIPLNKLNVANGGLIFLDTDINFPVQKHIASKVKNFSSYIPIEVIKKLELPYTEYEYNLGDASYHFINSIHYSNGNRTEKDALFLVFRYSSVNSKIDKASQARYESCYKKHLLNLQELN